MFENNNKISSPNISIMDGNLPPNSHLNNLDTQASSDPLQAGTSNDSKFRNG